jgi:Retrotransposon gag protein
VEGWVERSYDWLDKAKQNPDNVLSFSTTAWEVLEQDFHQAFIDYAEHERAQDEIWKLCIKDENIDEYIAAFECLGHHAEIDLDNPTALQLFTRGLPWLLADLCINIENPDSFEQWTKAAQRHQRNWLQKHTIHSDYGGTNNQQQ